MCTMNVYLLTYALKKKRSYHPFNAVILYISTNIVVNNGKLSFTQQSLLCFIYIIIIIDVYDVIIILASMKK